MGERAAERYDVRVDNKVVEKVLNDGPVASSELPSRPTMRTRRVVPLYRVNLSSTAGNGPQLGKLEAVYYLKDMHSPIEVVREIVECNPTLLDLEDKHLFAHLADHAEELADAWYVVREEYR